ncbi:MAG: hypothetical protein ACREHG_05730 [Candidatus Saccharimonadales bacterium]
MPILKPEIQKVLQSAGLPTQNSDFDQALEFAGLSDTEILGQLSHEMSNGDTSASRIRAVELALKAKRRLTDNAGAQIPSVTIVINDAFGDGSANTQRVNPILIPRKVN